MKLNIPIAAAIVLASLPVHAQSPNTREHRLVGTYASTGSVTPCNNPTGTVSQINAMVTFHAGGTVSELARFPPAGIPWPGGGTQFRTSALGSWDYDPSADRYTAHFRFYWFVNNVYHGYQVVERDIQLDDSGNVAAGPVVSVRYLANGQVFSDQCGIATSTRI